VIRITLERTNDLPAGERLALRVLDDQAVILVRPGLVTAEGAELLGAALAELVAEARIGDGERHNDVLEQLLAVGAERGAE
jgi:hypothetical protein